MTISSGVIIDLDSNFTRYFTVSACINIWTIREPVEAQMTKGQIESKGYSIMSIGIVLICFSFLFMFVGSYFSNPGFSELFSWGSVIMGLSILITVAGVIVRATEKTPPPKSISPTSQSSAVTKEKETIVKEVVMIPCKYCGGLEPQTSVYCPHCGAKRKA